MIYQVVLLKYKKQFKLSLYNIKLKTEIKDKQGDLTGEQIYLYQPKSFLIIGSLSQFEGEHGVNEAEFV